jgi:heat shock protein HtpX
MPAEEIKTFWDVEKEKTWSIYIVFGFLLLLYFFSVFVIWMIIKIFMHIRVMLSDIHAPFLVLGPDTLFILIIATTAAVIHWYYSNNKVVDKILYLLNAKAPDKRDRYHYIFQNVVDEIETSAGAIKVERYILPTGAMNAFALADLGGRRVIGITEGLVSRLSRNELQSVVAHEMAHIVSNDCLQTTISCSLFGVYSEALARISNVLTVSEHTDSPIMEKKPQKDFLAFGMLTIPILIVLFVTDILGQLVKMFMSREREYRADASAVKLTRDPLGLASALYKIATHWRGAGYGGEYLSPIFILSPKLNRLSEQDDYYATLFSTHPPLRKRLQILLDFAHADIDQIAQELQKKTKIKTEPEVNKPAAKFFAEHDNTWSGPVTMLQLQTFDWLMPDTKLKIVGSNEIINANDIPALNHFFKIRNEPIWKIKRLCPICREWLVVQAYEGLYIWRCAYCDGMLAEHDKLPRIFVRKERGFTEKVQHVATLLREDAKKKHPRLQLVFDVSHPRPCPKCGQSMMRKLYSYAYHVEIDQCQKCKLIWFDADELEILQYLIEIEEGKS